MKRLDRINRTVLSILGLILLAVGAYGLARGLGAFGDDQADEPVLADPIRDFFGRNTEWLWPVLAVVALIIAYLAYRWLKRQIKPTPTLRDLDVTRDSAFGSTRLKASGAMAALSDDIERNPEVSSADAKLLSDGRHPEVQLNVDVFDDANIGTVRRHIEEQALIRFARAVEAEDLRAHIRFGFSKPAERVVE